MDDNQVPVANEAIVSDPVIKMLSQDEVNKIVGREKTKVADSVRQEMQEKHQREIEAINAQQQQRNSNVSRDSDADTIYQQVQERFNRDQARLAQEMQERQTKEQMSQVANNYLQKVNQAKSGYEDFDEVTKTFDPTSFPQVTYLVAGMENGGDLVYELAKNPSKLVMIDRLAEKNPAMAHAELLKLSKSISDNRQAQSDSQNQNVSEPLDRLTPSRIAGSNGKMTISDLRNQPWMRG